MCSDVLPSQLFCPWRLATKAAWKTLLIPSKPLSIYSSSGGSRAARWSLFGLRYASASTRGKGKKPPQNSCSLQPATTHSSYYAILWAVLLRGGHDCLFEIHSNSAGMKSHYSGDCGMKGQRIIKEGSERRAQKNLPFSPPRAAVMFSRPFVFWLFFFFFSSPSFFLNENTARSGGTWTRRHRERDAAITITAEKCNIKSASLRPCVGDD